MGSYCSRRWSGIMKLLNVNIWVAVSVDTHSTHRSALDWLAGEDEASSLCFCRVTQQRFIRLLTTSVVMKGYGYEPYGNSQSWSAYEDFISDPRIVFAPEPPGLDETWKSLALRKKPSPKLWMDAYLAAFAIRSGFQLVSEDKAFSQFKGLDFHLIEGE